MTNPEGTLREKTVKSLGWSVIEKWGPQGLNFVVIVILSRLLTPQDFGIVALAKVLITASEQFVYFGFAAAVIQRKDIEQEHLHSTFVANLASGVLIFAALSYFSPQIAALFNEPGLQDVLIVFAVSVLIAAFNGVQQAILLRQMDFRTLAVRKNIASVVGGLLGIVLAFMGFGVWSLVFFRLVERLVGVIILWRVSDYVPKMKISWLHYKQLVSYGAKVWLQTLVSSFSQKLDRLIIGYFVGSTILGYYVVATQLVDTLFDVLVNLYRQVTFSAFSRIQEQLERVKKNYIEMIELFSLATLPMWIGLAMLAPQIITQVYGPKWAISIVIMQIFAISSYFRSVSRLSGPILNAINQPNWNLGIQFINSVVNIGLIIIAAPMGIVAIAWAVGARTILLTSLPIYALKRFLNLEIKILLKKLWPAVAAAALMGGAVSLALWGLEPTFQGVIAKVPSENILNEVVGALLLLVYVGIGGLAYLAAIYVIERSYFARLIDIVGMGLPKKLRQRLKGGSKNSTA